MAPSLQRVLSIYRLDGNEPSSTYNLDVLPNTHVVFLDVEPAQTGPNPPGLANSSKVSNQFWTSP